MQNQKQEERIEKLEDIVAELKRPSATRSAVSNIEGEMKGMNNILNRFKAGSSTPRGNSKQNNAYRDEKRWKIYFYRTNAVSSCRDLKDASRTLSNEMLQRLLKTYGHTVLPM
ncbi:hypothetical protein [Treponema vincentii]|uniref:hypothetical protein n=1 Tax=Treponema vincentii TaxID=69710 RepID=UPI0020A2FCF9|nr:hypothetical protein [Treponema vincentii]